MRSFLYVLLAALCGLPWHALLCAVAALGLKPAGTGTPATWEFLPLVVSVATSASTALLLKRFIARAGRGRRFLPVTLAFWIVGGALWPLLWLVLATVDHGLRHGWGAALSGGESLFLALVAPYVGFAFSVALIWIVWPLAALEVWLLRRFVPPPPLEPEAESEPLGDGREPEPTTA